MLKALPREGWANRHCSKLAAAIERETRRDEVDGFRANSVWKQLTLVVESQLYTTGALVSFDAYTIGKLPNHKGR